jgi:4-cresol dehydrogenase (hydroxylating)
MASNPYDAALAHMTEVVGLQYVITDASALRSAETSTFSTGYRIPGIIRPGNLAEVQECVRVANRFRVPIYPISSGKNWGYGSRVPAADGCFLLDLGRMNRIVDFNEELAYVTVEPGVTQAQLYDFLRERGSKLWMDATGASPACSLIGNTVERGFGHTPYGDHFGNSCGLEIVLPTGRIVQTGFARFPGATAASSYRWGVGPSLDGLFSQSNLGIVTRMTLWLMPAPEYFQAYYFRCEEPEQLPALVDALRPLRLDHTIRGASHIANDYKVLSALEQYPWERAGGVTPLPGALMRELHGELKIGSWNGSGALYGTKRQVKEARRLLRRALGGIADKLQFLDDRTLRMASAFAKPYEFLTGWNLKRTLALLEPVYGLMKGIPTEHPLASTYWRRRTPPPAVMDPDRDGCGLLWASPVAPASGRHASKLTALASGILLDRGFEPMISLTMITERSLACVVSIAFDRELAGEDARALDCYHHLMERLAANGYYSYRLGLLSMARGEQPDSYSDLLRELKRTMDPAGILAPGRYVATDAAVAEKANARTVVDSGATANGGMHAMQSL